MIIIIKTLILLDSLVVFQVAIQKVLDWCDISAHRFVAALFVPSVVKRKDNYVDFVADKEAES